MPSSLSARSLGRRTVAVGLTALLAAGVLTTVTPAAPALAASPLACDQNTVYSITNTGQVRSVDLATGTVASVATLTGATNGLGIGAGGLRAYATGVSNGVPQIITYDREGETSTPTTRPEAANLNIIRGGVNPQSGSYYYAAAQAQPQLSAYVPPKPPEPGVALGRVGTIGITGNTTTGNGDLAFSRSGTMFVVSNALVQRADVPVPTTSGDTPIPTTNIATLGGANAAYNGIAFSHDGTLFLSRSTGTAQAPQTTLTEVDPASGATIKETVLPGFATVDLATCNYPNTTSASTTIVDRAKPSDQFGVTLTGGGIPAGSPSATATTAPGSDTATAGPILAVGGTQYTVEQKPGNSTTLPADYATSYTCADGSTVVSEGTGTKATYTQPTSKSEASSEVTCSFVNVLAAAAKDDAEEAVSGVATTFTDLRANDAGTGLKITGVTQGSARGVVELRADGTVGYTADRGFSGTETFTYTVTDASGASSTATVTVTVAPRAVDDDATVPAQPSGSSTTVPAADLLGNDAGSGLTIVDATVVSGGGSVTVAPGGDLVYSPEPGTSGPASITYTVADAAGVRSTATVSLTVAPTPGDDTRSAPAGQTTTFTDLLANDLGTGLTVVGAKVVSGGGKVSVDRDGGVVLDPATASSGGTIVVTYTVRDASGTERSATLTVTVDPAAAADAKTVVAGTPTTFTDLAGNDVGTDVTVTGVSQGSAGGKVELGRDGSVTYTSRDDFSGTETFTYTAKDASGRTSTATVTVTVTPQARDDRATATPGESTTLPDLRANDLGRGLTVTAVTAGSAGGAVRLEQDGTVTYTPAARFSGAETFGYTVTDAAGRTSSATVTMTVAPAAVDDARSVPTGAATTLADLLANDRGSDLTVTAVTASTGGRVDVALDASGAVVVTPAVGFSGTEQFDYTVTDVDGQESTATVTLTVTPRAAPDAYEVPAETATTLVDVTANDRGQRLVVTSVTAGDQGGTTSVDQRGRVTHTGAPGFSGTETFGYTATDASGQVVSSVVIMTIRPTAADDARSTPADTALSLTDLVADDHGKALVVTAVGSTTAGGAASVDRAGQVTYVPATGFSGTDSFGYTATDAAGRTADAVVTVTVVPTAVADVRSTPADTALTIADLLANDHGKALRVQSVTAGDQGGTTRLGTDGRVVYTPADGFSGVETFGYTIVDAAGQTSSTTVSVTVTPTASPDARRTVSGQQTVFSLMGDVRGRGLRLLSVSAPAHGTATSTTDGWVTYVPDAGFSGVDTFSYRVADDSGQERESTVTVTVSPVATVDSASTPAGTPLVLRAAQLTGNDRGSRLAVTRVGTPSSGTATLLPDGSVRFVPAPGTSGAATFDYTVTDADGLTADSVVTVLVGPTATPDAATVVAGGRLEVAAAQGVLANDAGTGLTARLDVEPGHGTVALAADGSYTYEPAAGFSGTDTFTYTATDDRGSVTTGLVTVTVTPTAAADRAHVAAGTTLTVAAPAVLGNDLGRELVVVGHGAAAHGTLSIGSDGAVVYTPAAGWSGSDEVTYDVVDAEGLPASSTLTIVTDPVAVDDAASTVAGRALRVPADAGLLANDLGTGLVASIATQPAHGAATVSADGSWTYKPAEGFTGTDSFTYLVTSADGATSTATVTVAVRSAAVAADDTQLATPGRPVTIDPLANDVASGGQTLDRGTLVLVDPATGVAGSTVTVPGQGTWTVGADGVRFTPVDGFTGVASIAYRVADTSAETLEGLITLRFPAVLGLAFTGAGHVAADLGVALLVMLAGLGLVLFGRRRRPVTGPVRGLR
ncbi:hypothetical protein ABID92_002940 [Frigoribacterium sp. PvP120]|uniref:beta strand repeat-containing protein n=1 Tax=unclassified Frigoribacterium TaxID=2627005 RepID=UPI001AE2D188|nr:Ig-like domain-containing protein [Frigoribacterium sp. PvP121]MBP1240126.1 hypothetical protein [Frigoribacterium sp. PvP121]